ncbi:MAG: formate dehydrogenase subunit delta [Gammaproteobacteria bacterium]|nr:formate dehydrogenase subunit delta [Gammaproteobacteria bacterium]
MDVNKLVRMANQIAANLDDGKNPQRAIDGTVDHLKRFWTPAMRRQIVEHYRQGSNGEEVIELSFIAAQAVARLAEEQQQATA